jgi:hypothetical protein
MIFGQESETLEFKKTTSELKEGVVSIASILNKHSCGELYFGIKNDGAVIGQQLGERTLRVADEDKQMTAAEIESFFRRKINQVSDWDSSTSGFGFDDISEDKLRAYMKKANDSGRIRETRLCGCVLSTRIAYGR